MVYAAFEGGPCFGIVADNTQRIYITCTVGGIKSRGKHSTLKGYGSKKQRHRKRKLSHDL